jgi:hypothetical protein
VKVTVPMYEKGRSFVLAGGLVKAHDGHHFVYLHLLCQGLECIGKALLLECNYEKYEPILKDDYGHDLKLLMAEVDRNAGSKFFSDAATKELSALNTFYKKHILRYGDPADFKKQSANLSAEHVHRELVACLLELNQRFPAVERAA